VGQGLLQLGQIHLAGLHHRRRVGVVDQGQQEMLQGRIFVLPLIRVGDGAVE